MVNLRRLYKKKHEYKEENFKPETENLPIRKQTSKRC